VWWLAKILFIDGGRSAQIICNDLSLAQRTLCDGGLVSITDYFQERWPEVSEGVSRFMQHEGEFHPVVIGGNKFILTVSNELARFYRDELTHMFGVQARPSVVFGEPVLLLTPLTFRRWVSQTRFWNTMRNTPVGAALRSLGSRLR